MSYDEQEAHYDWLDARHKELCDKLDLIAVLLQTMVDMIRNAQDADEDAARAADIPHHRPVLPARCCAPRLRGNAP